MDTYNIKVIITVSKYAKVLFPEYVQRGRYYIKALDSLIRLTDVVESWPSPEHGSLVGFLL